jgi:UDP-3-O-[3-hydroxymyristoyl] glucosamine N-acyltransferase
MKKTLAEIAEIVGGEVVGDADLFITGFNGLQDAQEGDLSFIANSKYFSLAKKTKAAAIITFQDAEIPGKSIIRSENPSYAFSKVITIISEDYSIRLEGIHESAIISDDAIIGNNVTIGPYAIVSSKVRIGDNTVIYGGSYIGDHTTIGENCLIYPHVSIRERIKIGHGVIIHSGTVVGSDGFGYVQIDGIHKKIPQIGTVIIEDDVEIGSNVSIDRARFNKTIIGKGTKIDNLVQIAHNVNIGEHCIIISQAGIAGSTNLEKNSIVAGQAGLAGHITVGEGSIVASQSGVTKSIPPFSKVSGYPAKPHDQAKRVNACLQRLPLYVKEIQELKRKVEELERKKQ